MRRGCRVVGGAVLAMALAWTLVAAPAAASPDTLKRSVQNITLAPLDMLASPAVAGRTIYRNLNDIDDSTGVRVVYTLPGYAWVTMVQLGASVLRLTTGLLEFVPGLVLLPFEADLDPLFDPAEENEALVDYEFPFFYARFGIDYTTTGF